MIVFVLRVCTKIQKEVGELILCSEILKREKGGLVFALQLLISAS